jgi:hypothetical protein
VSARRLLWLAPAALVVGWYGVQAAQPGVTFFMEDPGYLSAARIESLSDVVEVWTTTAAQRAGTFNYRPLGSTVLGALAGLAGPVPQAFRLLNVATLAGLVALVVALLRRFPMGPAATGLGALALVLHPAVPDLLYWAVGHFDLLAALLVAGAMGVAGGERVAGRMGGASNAASTAEGSRLSWGRAALAVGLWIGACLAKEAAAPAIVPILLVAQMSGGARRIAGLAAPAGLAWLLAYLSVAESVPSAADLGPVLAALVQYAGMVVAYPPNQGGVYHLFDAGDVGLLATGAGVLAGGALLGVALLRGEGGARGDGGQPAEGAERREAGRDLLRAGLTLTAMLVPAALAVQQLVAQPSRYALLPLVATLPFVVRATRALTGRSRAGVGAVVGLLLASHAVRALPRPLVWTHEEALWRTEVLQDPSYFHATLAATQMARRPLDEAETALALDLLKQALATMPEPGTPALVQPCPVLDWSTYTAWCHGDPTDGIARARVAVAACRGQPADVGGPVRFSTCVLGGGADAPACPVDRPLCPPGSKQAR